ncbi:hypothetical protein EYF80_049359 [Liparis tanakae]|uniref:Uncharacterized protein n=1 Tax=Liparis tanakae TaxID=230148 RepID=A0A4Z2FHS4_9TELE|nr:hypothetical protein EYF80_049359 [Liparis tanakae]
MKGMKQSRQRRHKRDTEHQRQRRNGTGRYSTSFLRDGYQTSQLINKGGGEPEERQRARQKQSGGRPPGGGTRSGGRRTGTGSGLRRAETGRDGGGTKELKPSGTKAEHRDLGQAGLEIANWDRRKWSRPGGKRVGEVCDDVLSAASRNRVHDEGNEGIEYFVQDINLSAWSYQCVQSQQNEHQEKTGGPQLRQRHHGNSLRKYYERKSRPWEDRRYD